MINAINPLQTKASNPREGAWVSASAGTGKTKILTDRVIRLLLEGMSPSKILCLTFTNAAAGEMHERIIKSLKKLSDAASAASDKEQLTSLITSITGEAPSYRILEQAKSLYKEYLTSEDKVAIHTLHSYCQKILQRFPIEAGVTPNFTILDETGQSEAILSIKDIILKDQKLESLNKFFAENFHQSTLDEIFISILGSRKDFTKTVLEDSVTDETGTDIEELIDKASCISYSKYTEILNYPLVQVLIEGSGIESLRSNSSNSNSNTRFFDYQQNLLVANEVSITQLKLLFLTQKGEKRKKIASAKIAPKGSNAYDELLYLQERIYQMDQFDRKQQVDNYSAILAVLAKYCLDIYESYKKDNGYLDYDDLIIKSKELLCDASSRNWVLYKLDGGVDHLLVDEAQDTSKNQWEIIEAIIQEFFASEERVTSSLNRPSNLQGDSGAVDNRTLFVVGDQKQSIFSFQGADVKSFIDMNNKLTTNLALSGIKFNNIELDVSYRSAAAIIDVVYEVFSNLDASIPQEQVPQESNNKTNSNSSSRYFIFETIPYLKAHRNNYSGRVELWPLYTKEEQEEEFWPLVDVAEKSLDELAKPTPQERLAKAIAIYIEEEIESGKILNSTGKKICAGDFLVLFRTRSKLTDLVIEEIQKLSIEVTGLDRIKLKDDLLVQDIIAFAKFAINPHDDLNLAGLLKSPFLGKSEEEIYHLRLEAKNLENPNLGNHLCDVVDDELLNDVYSIYRHSNLCEFFQKLANLLGLKDKLHIYYPTASHDYLSSAVSFDSFRELLTAASNYQKQKSSSLQGFIDWFENSDIEIKRVPSSNSMVRIMTVHGSKGLQAPYVILCDTTSLPRSYDRILKDEDTGKMLSAKSSSFTDDRFKTAQQVKKDMEYYEHIRLLYVALTRAEDNLIVCGYNNKKSLAENSWYSLVRPAMKKLIKDSNDENDEIVYYTGGREDSREDIRLSSLGVQSKPETEEHLAKEVNLTTETNRELVISYRGAPVKREKATTLTDSPPASATKETPLPNSIKDSGQPHILSNILPTNKAPLKAISLKKYDALEYGKVFHKILEDSVKLDDITTMRNHPLIDTISESNRKRMILSMDKICANDVFLSLLKGRIKKEVSVGVPNGIEDNHLDVGGKFKIGRIDLMVINDHSINIIDYKSDNVTADNEVFALERYRLQLEFYRNALSRIYPHHKIGSYILWLETGRLELVS